VNYKFIVLLTTILTIGCADETRQQIEVRHFDRLFKLKEVMSVDLVTRFTKDSIMYSYKADSTFEFVFKVNKNNKNMLTYFNFNAPMVDKKTFLISGQEMEIKKYDYDIHESADEEESIYFNDNYGIVAIRGDVWGYFLEFNKGGQFEAELFKLLKKDTSGFYNFKIPPLPKIE
jgi:hypothetical protein